MFKKLTLLFSAVLLLQANSAWAQDISINYQGHTLYLHITDGHAELTSNSSNPYQGDIVLPDTVEYEYEGITHRCPLTTIEYYAFLSCSNLTSVTIPESVTSIGHAAFSGCSGLTTITIPESVVTIGDYAFYYCSSLTTITIPESVTSIGERTFVHCTGLTSVTIPESVTSIGTYAFGECSGLTTITIPESVTTIGDAAFSGCSGLTTVTLPESITSISRETFNNCTGLTSITIPESVTTIGIYAFGNCRSLTTIAIPESVTSIGDYAFSSCVSLTTITIPESVTSIGYSAFGDCWNVNYNGTAGSSTDTWGAAVRNGYYDTTTGILYDASRSYLIRCLGSSSVVDIPASVTYIADRAFYDCGGLTSVTIPASVTVIGLSAFYGTSITEITVPASVKSIGVGAFACPSLTTVNWNSDSCEYYDNTYFYSGKQHPFYLRDDTKANITTLNIGSNVKSLPKYFMAHMDQLTSVTLPNGLKSIGSYAFNGTNITEITIPSSVTKIGDRAFAVPSLNTVNLTNGLKSIGRLAFDGTNITEVTIPISVTNIGIGAFAVPSLTTVNWNAERCLSEDIFIYWYENNSYEYYTVNADITTLNIGSNVKALPGGFMYEMQHLTTVSLPDSIEYIGEYAFAYTALTEITIPSSVTEIGDWAFNSPTLTTVNWNAENCEFNGTPFFYDTTSRANITTLNIGSNVKSLPSHFMYGMDQLTTVSLPDSLLTIGSYAFSGCGNLNEIVIPDMVTTIDSFAFYREEASNISRLVLGSSVQNIAMQAFGGQNPDTIFVKATVPPTIDSTTFGDVRADVPIVVPCGTLGDYQQATYWNNFLNLQESSECASLITVLSNDESLGTVSGDGHYSHGSTATLAAMPRLNNVFSGWTDGSTDNPRTVLVSGDATYTANFTSQSGSTVIVHDTVTLTETVHDTVRIYVGEGEIVYDTIYIHDTVYVQDTTGVGVDQVVISNIKVYAADGQLVVEGTEGRAVAIFDAVGRLVERNATATDRKVFAIPTSGVYLVRVDGLPARRVAVVK
ncbi:MAG: leucine-rich repeat domain-containing protein [Bacteroidales bacterium]|nr:leucine-rich repeat domain-containing protein [Bacteroidales bacterium]